FPISMRGGTFIATDINNNIWISRGYFNNFRVFTGLARYNLNNNTWDSVDLGLNTSINDIYSDRAGKLWLILPDSGVACYDGQSLIRYHKGNSNILSNNINDIHVDSLGKVWFSTNLGISVLTPAPATVPNITTAAAINITESSAQVTGTILSNGGSIITTKGICWSVNANPTISNNKTVETTGNLSFISTLNSLTSGTKYYARAYAINAVGTAYGNEISFTTNNPIPGCVNAVLWPTAAVTVPQIAGQTIEITPGNGDIDCNFAGEYSRTDGWKDGLKYIVYSTNATDFITITDDNNNIIKSGTQPLEINNSGTGVKRIHVNLNSNCDKEDKCRDISVKLNGSTGLFDLDKTNHFSIYPNPSQGLLYLETDKIDFTTDPIIVKLYNTLGQEIPITYSAVNKTIIRISAPNTKSGIYSLYMRGNAQDYKTTIQIAD
ncbi:MAG: T9SS type A sorting domain-containing protein, partial [Bacteroidota bacterium]